MSRREAPIPVDMIALVGMAAMLTIVACLRQDFNGDGLRHFDDAIRSDAPALGTTRWLLFPALTWVFIHPLAIVGLITRVEPAVRVFVFFSVVSGVLYLWSLRKWLRAEGHGPDACAAAMVFAASTMPFLTLFTDVMEVSMASALVIAALAITRERSTSDLGDASVIALVAVIGAASLVYQALILALAFIPLVVPRKTLQHSRLWLPSGAIIACVLAALVAGRVAAGDAAQDAIGMVFLGEENPVVRRILAIPTPIKWTAAFIAAPAQAIIGLRDFQGLRALAAGLHGQPMASGAAGNMARLTGGMILAGALALITIQRRDWRLALAVLAILALPVIRNQQYTHNKFFALWPAVVALAAVRLPPARLAAVAAITLALNGTLLSREIAEGRAHHAAMKELYARAGPNSCFFTSDWSAPFPYLWPGRTTAVIAWLWSGDHQDGDVDSLAASVQRCFCGSSEVWTDTTAGGEAAEGLARQVNLFNYRAMPLEPFLFRPGDGSPVSSWEPRPVFRYAPHRQAELCSETPQR